MIAIENLSFAFKKTAPLFSDLNLNLQAGRTYGLFGLNGAGKTTLLNHMSGMLFPDRGECLISGKPARERLPESLSELFILPEQFELPAIDGDTYARLHAPLYPRFDRQQLRRMLDELEVESAKKLPELSYGQRKKFLIAFGLAANTRILLMDEPTNGLDIPSKSQFRKIMAATAVEDRCTIISTHQVRDLNAMIDRITVLNNGQIIFDQSIDAISRTLVFKKIREGEEQERIYGEEILGGESAICLRRDREADTEIDLELLFNAVINRTEAINRAFQNPTP